MNYEFHGTRRTCIIGDALLAHPGVVESKKNGELGGGKQERKKSTQVSMTCAVTKNGAGNVVGRQWCRTGASSQ